SVEGLEDLDLPFAELIRRWPNGRRYYDRVRTQGYQLEVVSPREHLERFYECFYRPYITERFGQAARTRSLDDFRKLVELGELLAVSYQGCWAAVGFNVCHADRFRLLALAFSSGRKAKLAGHAYYLFSFQRAQALKRLIADLGPDRPFLASSELSYKKR